MVAFSLFSCDDHIVEPPDCYTSRLPATFGDRIPRPENRGGTDMWVVNGQALGPCVRTGSTAGIPPEERENFQTNRSTYENVRPGVWKADDRLRDYDSSNVVGAVLFPDFFANFANPFSLVGDDYELRLACVKAHNDWMAEEFFAIAPNRLIPQALIPLWDMNETVKEVQRAAKIGHKGVCFGGSMDLLGYPWFGDRYWDPLWAVIQDSDMVLSIHRTGSFADRPTIPLDSNDPGAGAATWSNRMSAAIYPTGELMGSGVLERFPKLRVLIAEGGATWIPFVLQQLDRGTNRLLGKHGSSHLSMLPSEYFRRQVCAGFWWERIDATTLEILGEDNVAWEQDYPHAISPWPESQESAEYCIAPIKDQAVQRKVLGGNVARLFKIEAPAGVS